MNQAARDKVLLELRELEVTLASGVVAVDRVSFDIRRGECLALVGESGCGKTLTALSILRAIPPEVGRSKATALRLDSLELDGLDEWAMRRVRGARIGMVYQDPAAALDPLYTIGSQIVETLRAHGVRPRDTAHRRALDSLSDAGLAESRRVFDSYPHQLSGGQRQRAVIALALSTGPELLIADEPTTALDVTVQARIIELLAGLAVSRSLTLLLITHNLSLVRQLAGEVAIMYAGQIVESAPVDEMFSRPAHPYTRALLECIPESSGGQIRSIPGQVPAPGDWPSGCRFAGRCAFAEPACRSAAQELRPFGRHGQRLVRCRLAEAIASRCTPARGCSDE